MESKSAEQSPWLWLIAGPNGAGKSTWCASNACKILLGNIPILNPDNMLHRDESERALLTAGRQILNTMDAYVLEKRSFGIETTLSGRAYIRKADQLKEKGWKIGCIYIGLESAEQSIKRVEERKLRGGHGVPLVDIIRRYPRSLDNLAYLLLSCDYSAIFDNSSDLELLCEVEKGLISLKRQILPKWLSKILKEKILC